MWELACFLKLRKDPDVAFVSIWQKAVEVIIIMIIPTVQMVLSQLTVWGVDEVTAVCLQYTLKFVSVCIAFYIAQLHFIARDKLRKTLENYDVQLGKLEHEKDRALLLDHVDELFTSGLEHVSSDGNLRSEKDDGAVYEDEEEVRAASPVSLAGPEDGQVSPTFVAQGKMIEADVVSDVSNAHLNLDSNQNIEEGTAAERSDGVIEGSEVEISNAQRDHREIDNATSTARRTSEDRRRGLDAFSQSVRTEIPRYLPLAGYRGLKLFTYMASVIVSMDGIFMEFDIWAFSGGKQASGTPKDFANAWMGFRSVLAVCLKIFVMLPVTTYAQGALVYAFLWFQIKTGLPWWSMLPFAFLIISWGVTYILYMIYSFYLIDDYSLFFQVDGNYYINVNPLAIDWQNKSSLEKCTIFCMTVVTIKGHWWVNMLLWIGLVCICVFCYFVYEPRYSRMVIRPYLARKFFSRTKQD